VSTTLNVSKEHIAKTAGVCGGKACIAGQRIRVMDIVASTMHHGMTPDELLAEYPGLTLGDIFAALAYYHDNTEKIKADFQRERELDQFGQTQPSRIRDALKTRPELREKLGE
jgi:uncharacterized protein (DUF433 family)